MITLDRLLVDHRIKRKVSEMDARCESLGLNAYIQPHGYMDMRMIAMDTKTVEYILECVERCSNVGIS